MYDVDDVLKVNANVCKQNDDFISD